MIAISNRAKKYILPVLLSSCLFIDGCTVGARVKLSAASVEFPVSQTNSFYTANNHLVLPTQYEVQREFSFTFTKWGVSSPVEIRSKADISDKLNAIIRQDNGDAIVDLTISVSNPPVRNGLLWFTKAMALWTALISIPLTIIEPKTTHAVIAASATAVYLFIPAAAVIKVEGKVVRVIK